MPEGLQAIPLFVAPFDFDRSLQEKFYLFSRHNSFLVLCARQNVHPGQIQGALLIIADAISIDVHENFYH